MLNREKVIVALEQKRSAFEGYAAGQERQQFLIQDRLDALGRESYDSLMAWLDEAGVMWPGAVPTAELDQAQGLRLAFEPTWRHHQDAWAWALDVLRDRAVAAVDGSQITPTKDFSVPVGAVQIGWFINYHSAGGAYVKDIDFEILAPQQLAADQDGDDVEYGFPDWRVNQERFVRECEKLCALMADFAVKPPAEKPLCFFDGSFIISFAGQMRPERARVYVRAVEQLLRCSKEYRVPLVGFVDTSFSRDLVTLINLLTGAPDALALSDAGLLRQVLPQWGDRAPFFICAREDGLSREGLAAFYPEVAFTYVRLAGERSPARLEIPRWVLEDGQAETVVDLVRAECVVGTGYPYAIETADALAVISRQDRERFYALFEQFAQRTGLQLTRARKAASKQDRR